MGKRFRYTSASISYSVNPEYALNLCRAAWHLGDVVADIEFRVPGCPERAFAEMVITVKMTPTFRMCRIRIADDVQGAIPAHRTTVVACACK